MQPQVKAMLFVSEELLESEATDTLRGTYNTICVSAVPSRVKAEVHITLDGVAQGTQLLVRGIQGGEPVGEVACPLSATPEGRVEQTLELQLRVRTGEVVQLLATINDFVLRTLPLSVIVKPRS